MFPDERGKANASLEGPSSIPSSPIPEPALFSCLGERERLEAGGGRPAGSSSSSGEHSAGSTLTVRSWRTVPWGPLPDGWDESIPQAVSALARAVGGAGAGAERDKDALHWFSWEGFRTGGRSPTMFLWLLGRLR